MTGSHSILLAIETSQGRGGVALRDRRGLAHVERLASALRYDDDLVGAIERLYGRLDLEPRATEAVDVSIGPGGFTGLRIAVTTAKMLAETLGARVIAVESALVAAESCQGPGPLLVALAAKRQTVWATRLERREGVWVVAGAGGITDRLDTTGITMVLADEYLPRSMRQECLRAGVPVKEPEFAPRACLAVAARLLGGGRVADPLQLQPLYPRPPEAVTAWERRLADMAPQEPRRCDT